MRKLTAFAIGPVGSAVLGALVIPLVAWVFTPSDVGRMNILQITTSFVVVVASLGLDQAYVREFHEANDRGRLLRTAFAPGLIVVGACSAGALIFGEALTRYVFDATDLRLVWLAVGLIVVAYFSRFASLILRMHERALAFSLSQLLPKVGTVLGVVGIAAIVVTPDLTHLAWTLLLANLATAALLLYETRTEWYLARRKQILRGELGSYARFGGPLVLSGLAYWGLTATSTVAFRSVGSLEELGVYSVAVSIAGVAGVVQSFFAVIWAPIVYRWMADGVDPGKVDVVVRQLLAVVWFTFSLVGALSWLVDFVLPTEYSGVKYLVVGSIVPPLFYVLSEASSVGIGVSRRSTRSLWATSISLAISVALNFWLVPILGARGAIVSNAVAYSVFFVVRTELSRLVWRPFPRLWLYVALGVLAVMSSVTVLYGHQLGGGHVPAWFLLGLFGLWAFRPEWRSLLRYLPGR